MKSADRVLVTGVAGFIGSNVLDYLLEKTDWLITGIDNFSTGNKSNIQHRLNDSRFTFEERSVASVTTLRPYKYVFHLAALPRIQPSFDFVTEHINENLTNSMWLIDLMIRENY